MPPKYRRVLLKLSGEALAGKSGSGIDYEVLRDICKSIKISVDMGVQMAIVVGGGNYWRGRSHTMMDRTRADHIGMLATVMNSLALADALEAQGLHVRVQTAINMQQIAEPYIRGRAIRHMEKGRVVIFGCGTGNPFFSTDTASALRAAETDVDILFKATMVDGIYDSDPKKNPHAIRYDEVSFSTVLSDSLEVMDAAAAALCRENKIPMLLFNICDPENIVRALRGEKIGTVVKED